MSSKYAEMTNEELNVAITERVLGLPKPPPRTFREAERLNTNTCSCFRTSAVGWVAEVDWGTVCRENRRDEFVKWEPEHDYCRDIAAAWQVVEKMRERGLAFDCGSPHSRRVKISEWWARFGPYPHVEPTPGDTPARAICLASLAAIDQSPSPVSSKAGEFNQGSKENQA